MRNSKDEDRIVRKSIEDPENYVTVADQLRRKSGTNIAAPCQTKVDCQQMHRGPAYRVLYEHLVVEECPLAAKYFNQLVEKENDLVQNDLKFKKRVRDSHCLLMAIVENVKAAELGHRQYGIREQTLKLLVQTVHMIQIQDDAYHWLVKELYRIILHISEQWSDECAEILSRIRYEYGLALAENRDANLTEAIEQMSKSLEVCKGTMWYTNDKDRNILDEDVCVSLAETLLRQAKYYAKIDPRQASDLAHRAVLTITEVGISTEKNLYCIAMLRQSEYLISANDFEGAFKVLSNLQNHIMANDSPRNKCEFYLWLGICHFNLSPLSVAMRKFNQSLWLSENYNFAELRAEGLLFLGKIHAKNEATHLLARECFIEARSLFQRLRDFENEKLVRFLLAKLRAYQLFPNFIELMKRGSMSSFCYLFDLVQWKQKMLPFWTVDAELHEYKTETQCLLEEKVGAELPDLDLE